MSAVQPVTVWTYRVGAGSPLLWICGPCVIESHDHTLSVAETLRSIAKELGLQLVFKASFDKANRTSGKSFRGVGIEKGLKILDAVRRATGLPVTTDIHEAPRPQAGRRGCEVLRYPRFSRGKPICSRRADESGRVVNVKEANSWPHGT